MTHPEHHAHAAHAAAEAHMWECWQSLDDDDVDPDTAAPFCGCMTCEVRETLHAAYPHLRDMVLAEAADEQEGT